MGVNEHLYIECMPKPLRNIAKEFPVGMVLYNPNHDIKTKYVVGVSDTMLKHGNEINRGALLCSEYNPTTDAERVHENPLTKVCVQCARTYRQMNG